MDPQQHAGLIASFGAVAVLFGLAIGAFIIYLFWRIFTKAGMSGAFALLLLIPGIGWIVCLCILAFGNWRRSGLAAPPPMYPPPAYPPSSYPPASPPTQL